MTKEKISLAVVRRAVRGNTEAQMQVLKHYEKYINAIATNRDTDTEGNNFQFIDEELKQELCVKVLYTIPKWKEVF